MKELVERIQKDGRILGEGVLKVDSFVTHQVDPVLMEQMGKRFAEVFKEQGITKVVTIEASGIAPALFAAKELGVPMIFARKAKSLTMDEELLTASVYSFTKQGIDYRRFLGKRTSGKRIDRIMPASWSASRRNRDRHRKVFPRWTSVT